MKAAAPDLAKVKQSKEYAEADAKLGALERRLDTLYFIRDDAGQKIPFLMNEGQRAFFKEMALRNVLPKARKIGFSTLIAILICDRCVFRAGHAADIVDRTVKDAQDKLDIIRFAYKNLPEVIKREVVLVRDNKENLEWSNGSTVSVGTSSRGGTPGDLHVSEYGKVSVDNPDAAREIKTGAISAVPLTGRIWVESTGHGTAGEFCDMVRTAQAAAEAGRTLTAADFKFHFFGWWIKPEYRLPPNLVTIPHDLAKYFAEIEAKIGRRLGSDQRAWYAKELERLGPDDIKEEFPSTVDELFFVSLQGAYWRDEISRGRREKRIGQPVPFDPSRGVNTFWDIGEDCTAIWFHQSDGVRHRLIDYWECEGASLQQACGILDEKRRERGFVYREHYGPHDLDNKDWAHDSKTRSAVALGLGVKFTVVPRISNKDDSIEIARRFLNLCWIDQDRCAVGLTRLENYRKRWNKLLARFMSDPVHDIASHGSDALQQGAMGQKPDREKREDRGPRERRRGVSAWSA